MFEYNKSNLRLVAANVLNIARYWINPSFSEANITALHCASCIWILSSSSKYGATAERKKKTDNTEDVIYHLI